MYKSIYTNPIDHRIKWKKGDIVKCINNAGLSYSLTEGKEYKVLDSFREYNADEVVVDGDRGEKQQAFSTRFTTKKLERKEKLLKISNI